MPKEDQHHPNPQKNQPVRQHTRRPWPVTALCVILFIMVISHVLQAVTALNRWETLSTLPLTVSPLYLVLEGLLWSGVGAVLVIGLWAGAAWARMGTLLSAVLFSAWRWVDLLWIKTDEVFHIRWPFNAALTLLGLALVFIILHVPINRAYFQHHRDD